MSIFWFLIRLVLKVAFAPVVLALMLFIWICAGIVFLSSMVLGLVSAGLCLLAVALLLLCGSVEGFVIYLFLAFLASPFGLPTAAFWLLGKVQGVQYMIRDAVYG